MTREPKNYQGIMVSSTYTDLKEHRQKVMDVIRGHGFKDEVMEYSGANPTDVITQSLNMVADCAAYVLLISHKYGQTPRDETKNPNGLSITELEFNKAVELGRPRLLFVMSDDHPTTKAQIETDAAKQTKLVAFKRRAKLANPNNPDSDLTNIYEEFSSPSDLATKAAIAIPRLIERLRPAVTPAAKPDVASPQAMLPPIKRPGPPVLRAVPAYGVVHEFFGRNAELDTLDHWGSANDAHPTLLFEAIGGNGKSMLTWHWLNAPNHAGREGWAGRFWYSFYEQGATLAEFCREALSYMTGHDIEVFRKLRGAELSERLLAALNSQRWLLVLDGIERILVGYQNLDAPHMRDEVVEAVRDRIADRDPCLCIRPEDDDLLRSLAQVSGSKLLISSRLTPAAFINRGGTAIAGIRRELLKGLRPPDAVALFRSFGVSGPDQAMQDFLQANCDGHPLTIGALAGLVNNFPPEPGNFMRWRDDPHHGGALNLADCDLVQKRNHILDAAINALAPKTREVLQGLAILRGGADYNLLLAINPFLLPEPKEIKEPEHPEKALTWWSILDKAERREELKKHDLASQAYRAYLVEKAAWQVDPSTMAAPGHLDKALNDLKRRGLLQYDPFTRRYDLHPVVRGVASGRMQAEEVAASGSRVVDYCQAKSPSNWNHAQSLADVELGLQAATALLRMGRFDQAFGAYCGSLSDALYFNLEANDQILAILRGFFPHGWDKEPALPDPQEKSYLLNTAAMTLSEVDPSLSRSLYQRAIKLDLQHDLQADLPASISNFSGLEPLATQQRLSELKLTLGHALRDNDRIFVFLLDAAMIAARIGDYVRAENLLLDLAGREPPARREMYRLGELEWFGANCAFYQNCLNEAGLSAGEDAARRGRNRFIQRKFSMLRGCWLLGLGQPRAAIVPLQSAIAMARDVGAEDQLAEAALALARLRAGEKDLLPEPHRWDMFKGTAILYGAWFWRDSGDLERARSFALRAFRKAHDPGEPYVYRWMAEKARALLVELGETPPDIPSYDPATAPAPYSWEAEVRALIGRLEAENAAKDAKKAAQETEQQAD